MCKRLFTYPFGMICVFVCVFVLAACDNNNEPQVLPTLVPSETPITQQEDATPTREGPTARPFRPTLPPTYTPTPMPTEITPTATLTPDSSGQVESASEPEACAGFGPDTLNSDEEIQIGNTATISWRPVAGAGAYWVLIFDGNSNPDDPIVVDEHYTQDTNYTIAADVFRAPVRYGWEVRPLDTVGIQMCQGRGGLINVRP